MARRIGSVRIVLLAGSMLAAAVPSKAAEVTSDRLVNADKEPGNWLMNHRTYDAQRYSPLDKINKTNVKGLKLAYAVAIGGTSANENLEATMLAEDGFLYVVDVWGVLYKIDGRSGDMGRIVWRMDPGQEKAPDANRGAALWGRFVVSVANFPPRVIATDKETGKVAWETNLSDGQAGLTFTAVADRRRRHVGHRVLRRRHQSGAVGNRQSGAVVRSVLPPRRQSLHRKPDLVGSRHRQDELVSPVSARRHVGL
jgi:glucose dehydrogenase